MASKGEPDQRSEVSGKLRKGFMLKLARIDEEIGKLKLGLVEG